MAYIAELHVGQRLDMSSADDGPLDQCRLIMAVVVRIVAGAPSASNEACPGGGCQQLVDL